jgi:CBS domain-containing protein
MQISSYMDYSTATSVKDIMTTNPEYVYETTSLAELIKIMIREQVNEVPVIDKDRRVIGEVNFLEIIAYYLKVHDQI